MPRGLSAPGAGPVVGAAVATGRGSGEWVVVGGRRRGVRVERTVEGEAGRGSYWGLGAGVYFVGAAGALGWSLRRALAARAVVRGAGVVTEARTLQAWGELLGLAELRR